jgi:hypothetical protein
MPRYIVQFKTSGIVAFSATERAICQHWYECNNYGPDVAYTDPETGDVVPDKWVRGEDLGLFTVKRVVNANKGV